MKAVRFVVIVAMLATPFAVFFAGMKASNEQAEAEAARDSDLAEQRGLTVTPLPEIPRKTLVTFTDTEGRVCTLVRFADGVGLSCGREEQAADTRRER